MGKTHKIVRTKRMYKKRSPHKKIVNMLLFIILLFVLVGLGFIVSKEWERLSGEELESSSLQVSSGSDQSSSSDLDTTSDTASSFEQLEALEGVKAIAMTASDLQAHQYDRYATFLNQAKQDGYNAVYVELKSESGTIQYNSLNEMAIAYGTVSQSAVNLNELVVAIETAGLTPIAQISTLKDGIAAHVLNENSYAYDGQLNINWLDDSVERGGKPWLNPYMDNARQYICDISKEITDAGFEAIVLDNMMFPDKNTDRMTVVNQSISYTEILKQLVDEVQSATGDAKVYLGFDGKTFAKTNQSLYNISAKDIGHRNIVVSITNTDLTQVLFNYSEEGLTKEQKVEAITIIFDEVSSGFGENASVVTFVQEEALENEIQATIDAYKFSNTIS